MKKVFENLWNEYFYDVCSSIDTEEEKALIKKAGEMHKEVTDMLSNTQNDAIEKYIEFLYEIQSFCIKKAFFKGCQFSAAFLFGTIK